jgi:hypothetical protein
MGRKTPRLAMWALAILTSFAVAGNHSAFANDNHGARVNAGGQFTTPSPFAPSGSAKVTFGVTGKFKHDGTTPDGRFEYFNHSSGLQVHGELDMITFGTASPACVAFGDSGLAGKPSATVHGQCKDGSCSFSMELVDGDDSSPNVGDYVCNVNVSGNTKMHMPGSDSDPAEPVTHGNVEVRNY